MLFPIHPISLFEEEASMYSQSIVRMGHLSFSFFIAIGFLLLVSAAGWAQEEKDDVNAQLWLDITLSHKLSNKIELYGDGGYRRIFGTDIPWNRLYIRPAIKYSPLTWLDLRGGVGLFFTDHSSISNSLELRPWQGIKIGWPEFPHFQFSHYFRLEQRFVYDTEIWDNSFGLRFRYQLSTHYQPDITKQVKYIYFPAFMEIFADRILEDDVKELFANETRTGLGIGYTWDRHWSGEFMFIFQRSRNELENFKTSDLLFRLSLRHKLSPQRDKKQREE